MTTQPTSVDFQIQRGDVQESLGRPDSELIEHLASGALFEKSGPVEMRETHASLVFLTESDVYKLKKPVNLGFLDYSTLRRRARMCRKEIDLNRRLAPDVYLGVERVRHERNGSLRLNGNGRVVDYLVHMRRVPDEVRLDVLLDGGDVGVEEMRRVGERIGVFHAEAAPAPLRFGPRTFFRNAWENLVQLREAGDGPFLERALAEFESYLRRAESTNRAILDARAEGGWIRDGHGDLRAEHVYFEDVITILDCVEFNDRYRMSDTALDFAFLAMDMSSMGYPDLVRPLVEGYEAATGDGVEPVLPLYCWYRSMVRAKVASILQFEGGVPDETRNTAAMGLRRHLHHALRFSRGDSRPALIVVAGLPATGKSTLAKALGASTGVLVVGSDETRKGLAGLGPGEQRVSGLNAGLYTAEMNQRVYAALVGAAGEALERGRSVVLDGTFRRRADREEVRALAGRTGARFVLVECRAPDDVVLERLQRRTASPDPWSDATVKTFRAHQADHEPPDELNPAELVPVRTTLPLVEQVDAVLTTLWDMDAPPAVELPSE